MTRSHRRSGEFALIDWIRKRQSPSKRVRVGIGDDAAAIDVTKDSAAIISTDALIDGTHFDTGVHSPRLIGRKALACSLSDMAAMGCEPTVFVAAVALPRSATMGFCKDFCRGLEDMMGEFGVELIGGDVTTGDTPLVVTVTVLGRPKDRPPVKRGGARVGDTVMVTGTLGGSLRGKHLTFAPRVAEGLILNRDFRVRAMIDVSDGLAADLEHVAKESGVRIVLDAERIPISRAAKDAADGDAARGLRHALSDGEDFELAFTLSRTQAKRLEHLQPFDCGVAAIGEVVAGTGVRIRQTDGSLARLSHTGYEHGLSR